MCSKFVNFSRFANTYRFFNTCKLKSRWEKPLSTEIERDWWKIKQTNKQTNKQTKKTKTSSNLEYDAFPRKMIDQSRPLDKVELDAVHSLTDESLQVYGVCMIFT